MKLSITNFKSLWRTKPWFRVYLFALFLIPVPTIFLIISFFFTLPKIGKLENEINIPQQIREEIERTKGYWPENDEKAVRESIEEIRKNVPNSYEDVLYWVKDLISLAFSKGFVMTYTLGDLLPAHNGAVGFSLLPLDVKLKVKREANKETSGLIIFLKMLREIMENHYGVDLTNITVTGSGVDLNEIDLNLNLWVGFESDIIEP